MYMSVNKLPQWLCLSFPKGKEVNISSVAYNRKDIMTELAAQGPACSENPLTLTSQGEGTFLNPYTGCPPALWNVRIQSNLLPTRCCQNALVPKGKIYFNSLYLQNYTIPTAFWGGRVEEGSNEKPPPAASKSLQSNWKKKRQLEGVRKGGGENPLEFLLLLNTPTLKAASRPLLRVGWALLMRKRSPAHMAAMISLLHFYKPAALSSPK